MEVKFKGKVYSDAWRSDKDGHVWFGENTFEHIPEKRTPYFRPAVTLIHGVQQTGTHSFVRTSKKSSARVEILSEG